MSSDLFLTDEELVVLTGYRQHTKQVQQLRMQKIPFHANRAGHPRVARAIIEGKAALEQKARQTWSPSWAETASKS